MKITLIKILKHRINGLKVGSFSLEHCDNKEKITNTMILFRIFNWCKTHKTNTVPHQSLYHYFLQVNHKLHL